MNHTVSNIKSNMVKNEKFSMICELERVVLDNITEQKSSSDIFARINCIQSILEKELKNYNNENYDDRWVDIRTILRKISNFRKIGYFQTGDDERKEIMSDFLKGLNYSDKHTYEKGEVVGNLKITDAHWNPDTVIPIYRAIGDKTLFRSVSLDDWNRVKRQGFLDSDMRRAILSSEGINLAQTVSTAHYYLPHGKEGVILAISPKGLDLYMLKDEYIRVFEPIPIKNIIKVSDVFCSDEHGGFLTKNTERKVKEIIDDLKEINVIVDC